MKENKGFTLVELLCVIAIIGLLTAIAVPSIFAINNRMKEKSFETEKDLIEDAAIAYAEANSNSLKSAFSGVTCSIYDSSSSSCVCTGSDDERRCYYIYTGLTVGDLVEENYLSANSSSDSCSVTDPRDSSVCIDNYCITLEISTDNDTAYATLNEGTACSATTISASGTDLEGETINKCQAGYYLTDCIKYLADTNTNTRSSFSSSVKIDEGVFSMADDYGTSYYFRGAVTNNYVYFAGLYWRIIRANGDGTIRIIYDGTSAHENKVTTNDAFIKTSVYNSNLDSNCYVGYMYGTRRSSSYSAEHANTNNSTAKSVIDSWYVNKIYNTVYKNYLADEIFCNDRSLSSSSYKGYSTNNTLYAGYTRVYTNNNPTFKCPQQHDAFTVSDTTKGNGDLTYPVGMITADEVIAAGKGSYSYLYRGSYYTMTPSRYDTDGIYHTYAEVLKLNGSSLTPITGIIFEYTIDEVIGIRPVLNLSSDVVITEGDGTMDYPYRITI